MRAVDIIIKKRNSIELSDDEIRFIIQGIISGQVPEYQLSALLMAIYFNGMTKREAAVLTHAMKDSGDSIDLSCIAGPKIDKHSTGGVGDKVSLVLAPLAASCGVKVPMMAGRGLGHTGGTLDKLEAIPGYSVSLTSHQFIDILDKGGYAIMGQSKKIAPADRFMYALRDVTGTVESIPLITASILSKKCAEGADGFVFDVKTGSGAFMKNIEDAEALAVSLGETAKELGKKVTCIITDMDEPLGYAVGNLLEVKEVVDCLKGKGPGDVMEVTCCLTSHMLLLAGVCDAFEQAKQLCDKQIANGAAMERFLRNISLQGGKTGFFKENTEWPAASCVIPYKSLHTGYIQQINTYKTGIASCLLGAGRAQKDEEIDPYAGILLNKKRGDKVVMGEDIALIHTNKKEQIEAVTHLLNTAFIIGKKQPEMIHTKILRQLIGFS